ncbi:MAG TPA: hypothetical protein VKB54_07105 [Solirubrobacteraceae bacterium]|nr:hypothetical protein [Solirubrobacteraceae bacterium]
MAARTKTRYRQAPDAEQQIARISAPQVLDTAQAIANAIPEAVPVQSGTSRRLFRQGLRADRAENGKARVSGLPPHWHWFEHGTRWNPPYTPIRSTVERFGMRYVPS